MTEATTEIRGTHGTFGDRIGLPRAAIFVALLAAVLHVGRLGALAGQPPNGFEAYERGDFVAAHEALLPRALDDDARAQLTLGMMYRAGQGVTKDFAEAARWYRRAAEQGNPLAQTYLAISYALGRGVPLDRAMALRWYRRAALQDHQDAQVRLAAAHEEGRGTPVDFVRAYVWYAVAASRPDDCGCLSGKRERARHRLTSEEAEAADCLVRSLIQALGRS